MRWNLVKKTVQWAVFGNAPEGFSLRGLVARRFQPEGSRRAKRGQEFLLAAVECCRSGDCQACFGKSSFGRTGFCLKRPDVA